MRIRPYILAILATMLCITVGICLPPLSFSQKNRSIISYPSTARMDSTTIRYTSTLTDVLRITTSDYKIIEYGRSENDENYNNDPEEIIHIGNEYCQILFDYYNIDFKKLLGEGYVDSPTSYIIISDNSSKVYDTSKVEFDGPIHKSKEEASLPHTNEQSTDRESNKNPINNIAFVWIYNYIGEIGEITMIIDDSTGYVVCFSFYIDTNEEWEYLCYQMIKDPEAMKSITEKFLDEYYKDNAINIKLEYYNEKNKLYSKESILYYSLNYSSNEEELPFEGSIQLTPYGLYIN